MTGIIRVGEELDKLKFYEEALDYYFKANKEKTHPSFKRHILFKEIREDFQREVSSYGFCPYIHKPFSEQIKDKNLMKFKKNPFVNFFLIYAKQSNKSLEETNKERLKLESTKKKKKVRIKKGKAYSAVSSMQSESDFGGEEEQLSNRDKSNIFLSKALNTIKSKNSLFGDLLIDKAFKTIKKKKLGKSASAPNLNELDGIVNSDQSILKQSSPFEIYKKIEKSLNDPKLKDKLIPLIPNWTSGLNKGKNMAIQTFGKKFNGTNSKSNENVMISMLKTRYNLLKEKEMDQKRKNELEKQKAKELELERTLKTKAKLAREERIKMENEIMKDKENIFRLADVQHKRSEFLQKFVDEEDEQLSDNDPLIVYGLIKKKSKK